MPFNWLSINDAYFVLQFLKSTQIATNISLTERNKEINLINLLEKTKYGSDGMGGIICNGLMYVGYLR